MMKKLMVVIFAGLSLIISSLPVQAKIPPKIEEALKTAYPPAEYHRALETAYEQPIFSKMRGYVVVLKGGIPAEHATRYISWAEYDYRGVIVRLDKGGEITTRRGPVYTYLQPGDVMAVVEMKKSGQTIYLKLMSADIYVPENRKGEKHYSRVTVMFGITFPKDVFAKDDEGRVLAAFGEWLKPFPNLIPENQQIN